MENNINAGAKSRHTTEFYAEIDNASKHRQSCEIVYRDNSGFEQTVFAQIIYLLVKGDREYIRLANDEMLDLDSLVSINGVAENIYSDPLDATTNIDSNLNIIENDYYRLSVDKDENRIYLLAKQNWSSYSQVPDFSDHLALVLRHLSPGFTFLNDLTELKCSDQGTLLCPPIPNRDLLMMAGLAKVADLLPLICNTIVHGKEAFSVNSIRLRNFNERSAAENYLTFG